MNHFVLFAAAFGDDPLDWLAVAICVVVFGLLAAGGVLVARDTIRQRGNWGINLSSPHCSACGEAMPAFRKPANFKQTLWGGWTCPKCGVELDKWGRPVEQA